MASVPAEERFMSLPEVAEYLGVKVATLRYWITQSTGPASHKFGKHRRYLRADVDDWAKAHRREAA